MNALIEFSNVTVARDSKNVLEGITLSIHEGEQVAILGPNGSGKSSLIKTITRECYPRRGSSLKIFGQEIWNLFELRALLGIVSNDLTQTCTRDFSAREVVLSGFFGSIGLWPYYHVTPEMECKAEEVLDLLEIGHLATRSVDEMSSGEARRVVIARALVHDPRALVLDEPTTSLDFRAKRELLAAFRKLAQSGIGIVMVTHSLTDIIPEINRVILLKSGRIVADGPKAAVLTPAALSALFGTPVEIVERRGYYHLW
ncbi:MAG: ATP-binding cassette domain-containing protein [Acidobacteria bacterium]|nr:ATP-binding cassette domain-containing protein [Acidobacteriota bacterium]